MKFLLVRNWLGCVFFHAYCMTKGYAFDLIRCEALFVVFLGDVMDEQWQIYGRGSCSYNSLNIAERE